MQQRQLIGDVPTRWAAKYDMITRFLENENPIRIVLSTDRKACHHLPTWQKIDILKSIVAALAPLNEFTNILSGDTYSTISSVIPLVTILIEMLNEVRNSEGSTQLTKDIIDHAACYITAKYTDKHAPKETRLLLNVCTFLDPRFKGDYLDKEISLEALQTVMLCDLETMRNSEEDAVPVSSTSTPGPSKPSTPEASVSSSLSITERLANRQSSRPTASGNWLIKAKQETVTYHDIPVIGIEEDPLAWWKVNSLLFPNLALLARKYLSVPATSTPSERLFSASGNIITSKRSRLNPTVAEKLVFCYKNLN